MSPRPLPPTARRALLAGAPALLAGCTLPAGYDPVPLDRVRDAQVIGLPNERFCVTEPLDLPRVVEEFNLAGRRQRRRFGLGPRDPLPASHIIAFSGGGENGAFGAGLACGWTVHGDRPEFTLVTGISTGALTAPLVFAGPHRDAELRAAYTEISAADILEERGLLAALFDDSVADNAPLARTIARIFDERLMAEVAEGYLGGRQLIVGTTNLEAQRPVGWNLGAIAASGHPRALALCRQVLLASAAVPGVFPPVVIDVTVNGRPHQELHVDGGTYAQAYLYPPGLGDSRAERIRQGLTPPSVSAYVVRNGRLNGRGASVRRRTLAIAERAISILIGAAGVGDIFRIQATAERHGIGFHLAHIEDDFTEVEVEPYGQAYLRALFAYGYGKASAGYPWKRRLPA
jgi:predicted acylesterase/phospholipase RssA